MCASVNMVTNDSGNGLMHFRRQGFTSNNAHLLSDPKEQIPLNSDWKSNFS